MFQVIKIPVPGSGGGGSGEANTGANVGGGSEVFQTKVGVALNFRTLVQGPGINIVQNPTTLNISANLAGGENVETIVLSPAQVAAQAITLAGTPAVPAEVKVDVIGGCAQGFGADFTVVGNTLSWVGLGMATLGLAAGDTVRITYFI